MKKTIFPAFCLLVTLCSCKKNSDLNTANPVLSTSNISLASVAFVPENFTDFMKGADLSFLNQLQSKDYKVDYKDNGISTSPILSLKNRKLNYVRLRIWVNPGSPYHWNSLDSTLEMAQAIKAQGMKLLLDFHYSDTWAGPNKQAPPEAWPTDVAGLNTIIYNYTKSVLDAFNQKGVLPEMVQIGNEMNTGILYETGHYYQGTPNPNFISYLKQAARAVRTVNPGIKIVVHSANGGSDCAPFYTYLVDQGVDFDIIGLSCYPPHSLEKIQKYMYALASNTHLNKRIIVAETGFSWSTQNFDASSTQNVYSETGYTTSVDGQYDFIRDLMRIVAGCPNNKGVGVFYWPTEYTSTTATTVPLFKSTSENSALWDADSKEILSSANVFKDIMVIGSKPITQARKYVIINKYPNKAIYAADGTEGGQIFQADSTGSSGQQWQLVDLRAGNGSFKIQNVLSNKVLRPFSSVEGANVIQTDFQNNIWSMQWFLESIGNGYYLIRNRYSGLVLQPAGGTGADLTQTTYQNWDSQKWRISDLMPIQ